MTEQNAQSFYDVEAVYHVYKWNLRRKTVGEAQKYLKK